MRKRDPQLPIIFVSQDAKRISEGYQVNSLRFFVVPLQEEEIHSTLSRTVQLADERREELVITSQGDAHYCLEWSNLAYVQMDNDQTIFHDGAGFSLVQPTNQAKRITSREFVRVSEGVYARSSKIKAVCGSHLVIDDKAGTKLPIAAERVQLLRGLLDG